MIIATASQIRQAEQELFTSGATTSATLMDVVIGRLYQAIQQEAIFTGLRAPSRVIIYAGKGNNAGDAVGLAARFDCPITLRSVCPLEELSPETQRQYQLLPHTPTTEKPVAQANLLIIDGLLGSGASGQLRPDYAVLVNEMNELRESSARSLTLSIDIPTGLNADTGDCDTVVQADITAVIGCVKPGMLADRATPVVGRLLPIPLPEVKLTAEDEAEVIATHEPWLQLPRRPYTLYKNLAGRVAIVAGSVGMLGAAQMCAEAAVAAGAGLVVLYCLPDTYPLLATRVRPEIMVRCVASYADIEEPDANALVLGPGLGTPSKENTAALQELAARFPAPVVLDADALNLAATHDWAFKPNHILTPHPGEMRRLDPQPATNRRETVARFLDKHDCTLLLKGARSIIANRQHCFYNISGGPYMANGGQGDVLSGAIAALAAQGLAPLHATALAALTCGRAAEAAWATQRYPITTPASNIIPYISSLLNA